MDLRMHLKPLLRKPRALNYSAIRSFLGNQTKTFLLSVEGKARANRLRWFYQQLKVYEPEEIEACLMEQDGASLDALEHHLYHLRHPEHSRSPMNNGERMLQERQRVEPDLACYDRLRRWEVTPG
jgi:hypothetical protein